MLRWSVMTIVEDALVVAVVMVTRCRSSLVLLTVLSQPRYDETVLAP